MVFNLVFKNIDDHLKNHSFIYDHQKDTWNLAPAYDVTYALNPLLNYTNVSRALSIHGKRQQIVYQDLLTIAQEYAIKNPKGIVEEIQQATQNWRNIAQSVNIPNNIMEIIAKDFERVV